MVRCPSISNYLESLYLRITSTLSIGQHRHRHHRPRFNRDAPSNVGFCVDRIYDKVDHYDVTAHCCHLVDHIEARDE